MRPYASGQGQDIENCRQQLLLCRIDNHRPHLLGSKANHLGAKILMQPTLFEGALSFFGVESAACQFSAQDRPVRLAESLCQFSRPLVDRVPAGNRIGSHGFSPSLAKSQQRAGECSANLPLPRNTAAEGRGQRQPLRLAQAFAGCASGINRLGAIVVPRKKFHCALTLTFAHNRPPEADRPAPLSIFSTSRRTPNHAILKCP